MKTPRNNAPPAWATTLLSWYCRRELLEDLQGDLNEFYYRNVTTRGLRKARLIYVIDVIKFCRTYTLRRPKIQNHLMQGSMMRSYIKISGRNIIRNKLFSAINIFGLGVTMAVGLLLIGLLSDMHLYDKFHEHHDRIYRVITDYKYLGEGDKNYFASTSLRAGKVIEESTSGIEQMAVLYRGFGGDMKTKEKAVPLFGFWANEAFFKVFTFPMLRGNPLTALKSPYSVVLTEATAKKLFGGIDALGQIITYPGRTGPQEYAVTGVIRDVPTFSHLKFDMLASLSTRDLTEKDSPYEMRWDNIWNGYVYLLLPETSNLDNIESNFRVISAKENQTDKNTTINLSLQPLSEIALGKDLNNSIGPVMVTSSVWMVGVLSIIVILSACFNYTNLSIARSLRRSREVGIRKVVGALRSQVVSQFVLEAILISLLALIFSFGLFSLIKPYFLALNNQYREMLVLDLTPELVLYFILLAIGVGLVAGILPAVFFSRVSAIQVLKDISNTRLFRNMTLRKALIVVQFTISLMFIAATIIGYKHYKQVLAFDLGFDTENILNIRLSGNKAALLKKELGEMPEVKDLSTSSMITNLGNYFKTNVKYIDPQDSASLDFVFIDERYIPLHGHKLIAGRNFIAQTDSAAESEVIVNEKVLERFGIANGDPLKALGEIIAVNKNKLQIVGVLKNFQYGKSIDQEMKEVIFRYSPASAEYVNAKVISSDWPTTLSKIEIAWKGIDNVHPLDASFYDEQIERSYSDFSSRIKVIGSLSFLAIGIASIGLLGMVVFTTETRIKEISIRKVLGAGEASLVYLLSKGFLLLLGVAAIIALPATQFFFVHYVLDEYVDQAPAAWTELAIGIIMVMAIAFLMIGLQTLKVARSNPAEVLKND